MRGWEGSFAFAANFPCIPLPYRRCPLAAHDGIIVQVFAFCSPNASAVSDAPHSRSAQVGSVLGARSIQRFEGSRPWGGDYAYSIMLGLGEKLGEQLLERARARRGLVWESLRVVGTGFWVEVGNGQLVWGQAGRTTPAGGEGHQVSELGKVVSCGDWGERGWRTELDLGSGESLDDHHAAAAFGTEPK